MRFAAVLALGITSALMGCAERAVELRLVMPSGDDAELDVSCVTTVHVVVHDGSSDFSQVPNECIEVSSPTSLADLQAQIRGKLTMALPDEIIAVEVRGLTNTTPGACGTGMNVFYGGEEFVGQDDIALRVEGAMDCSALQAQGEHRIRPIDFLSLASTPADTAPVCSTLDIPSLQLGAIRPTNIFLPEFPTSLMEFGAFAQLDAATGLATLPAWGGALPTSCLASSSFDIFSASCIYPGNKSVCGAAGETEVPLLPDSVIFETVDREIFDELPVLVMGVVYDTVTKRPVEGATVTLDPERGRVVYASRGSANRLDPLDVTATTKAGLFLAYMREPSVATITQGASTKAMRLGGVTGWGSAVIVPLR
ncbi:MAG: hypothetical protein H0V17_30455 [Deltaproteobacteria bacterium]|nr:hypothetical protein [Deltaproteobacteria bacterium]